MLQISAFFMAGSGAAFAFSTSYPLILASLIDGRCDSRSRAVPVLEQAILPQTVPADWRTRLFSSTTCRRRSWIAGRTGCGGRWWCRSAPQV
jgi:hypothetical protein